MEKKKLLVLSAIFLALFLFVVLFERRQPTSEEVARARRNLLTLKAENVTAVTVVRPDLPKVDLKRSGDRWILETAPGGPADKQTAENLISDLGRLETLEEPRKEFDPKEFGLDAPKATVTLTLREGTPVKITFGQAIPGTDATAASEGGRMAAVKYAPLATLVKPVDEFRAKTLVDVPAAEITGLSVVKGTFKANLERTAGTDGPPGPWRLTEPVRDLAAQAFVDQLVADIVAARISEFAPVAPAELARVGLQPPVAAVTVRKGPETVSTIAVGAAKADAAGKVYARRDGVVVVTDDRIAEDLAKEFSAFREARLLPVDSWTVARVSFAAGALKTGAERLEGEWRSAGHPIPSTAAEDLLDRLTRIESKAFVPKKEYGARGISDRRGRMPAPLASLTIQRESGSAPEEVTFYAAAPLQGAPVVAAEVTGRADALLVDENAVEDLKALALKLRSAETTIPKGKPTATASAPASATAPAPAAPASAAPASPTPKKG